MDVGQVVTLVNGSFKMTVREDKGDTVICNWFTGSVLNQAEFFKKDIKV